jgi:hypothetical protein
MIGDCVRPFSRHMSQGHALRPLSIGVAIALSTTALLCGSTPDWTRVTHGSAARSDDFFGRSVATDGVRVVVGIPEYDLPSVGGAGVVAIFEASQGVWTRSALLSANDAATADVLGECVAIDGDLVIASAANVGLLSPAPWTGAAYIFDRVPKGWTQRAKLLPVNPSEFMEAGLASAIDAETRTAVVAARLDDDVAIDAGSVSVYREINGVWTLAQKLTAPDAAAGDAFGYRVAIDGDILAVATPATDALAESTGSVYIFERAQPQTGSFVFRTKLMATDAAYRDRFGFAVDVDATTNTIAVGAVGDDNLPPGGDQGAAYIFQRVGGLWSQTAKLVASDRAPLDAFGASVALDGTRLVVGASGASVGATNTGAAYLFEESGGNWVETAKFTASTAGANDTLGASVALHGSLVVAGAQGHDFPLANAGAIYIARVTTPCPPDLDGNGDVGASDLSLVLLAWGTSGLGNAADLNGDGEVGAADLSLLLEAWGICG